MEFKLYANKTKYVNESLLVQFKKGLDDIILADCYIRGTLKTRDEFVKKAKEVDYT